MVVVDVLDIVELLQYKMAWVVQDIYPGVVPRRLQKTLKSIPVVQVFPGVDFITDIHAFFVEMVQDGLPAPGQLLKPHLDQAGGALGPGMEGMPEQRP